MTAAWNSHKISSQNDLLLPNSVPTHMFYFPEHYGGTQKGIQVNQDSALTMEVLHLTS